MHPEEGLAEGGGGVLLCHGVTSHAVHAGGIAAGTGFLYKTLQMGTDMLRCPAPSTLPSSHPARVLPSLTTPIESQTKRNALFVF